MSGPKVVRVVTREERISICQGMLARLDEAIENWVRVGRRNDVVDDRAIEAVKARRDALRKLLEKDRFDELQARVPAELQFLQADMDERLTKAANAAVEANRSQRRLARTAGTILRTLDREATPIDQDLREKLSRVESGVDAGQSAEVTVSAGLKLLTKKSTGDAITSRQQELVTKLTDATAATSEVRIAIEDPDENRLQAIDRRLAEIKYLDTSEQSTYRERLAAIIAQAPSSQRSLLIDSLTIELASAVKSYRTALALRSQLAQLAAEMKGFDGNAAKELGQRIDATSIENRSPLTQLISEAEALITAERKRLAAEAARNAVLRGLATLGYEVREGMSTAWANTGQIALRKAANPEYGVELGSVVGGERLQIRVVKFGSQATSDSRRDKDMETIWCSEFGKLQKSIATAGGALVIEKALAVGATPVKCIESPVDALQDHADRATPKTRTLPGR